MLSTFFYILIFFSYSQKYIENHSYVFQYKILNFSPILIILLLPQISWIQILRNFILWKSFSTILRKLQLYLSSGLYFLPFRPSPPLYIPPPLYAYPLLYVTPIPKSIWPDLCKNRGKEFILFCNHAKVHDQKNWWLFGYLKHWWFGKICGKKKLSHWNQIHKYFRTTHRNIEGLVKFVLIKTKYIGESFKGSKNICLICIWEDCKNIQMSLIFIRVTLRKYGSVLIISDAMDHDNFWSKCILGTKNTLRNKSQYFLGIIKEIEDKK